MPAGLLEARKESKLVFGSQSRDPIVKEVIFLKTSDLSRRTRVPFDPRRLRDPRSRTARKGGIPPCVIIKLRVPCGENFSELVVAAPRTPGFSHRR